MRQCQGPCPCPAPPASPVKPESQLELGQGDTSPGAQLLRSAWPPVPFGYTRARLSPCSCPEVEGQNVTNNPCNEPGSAEPAPQGRVQWGPEPAGAGAQLGVVGSELSSVWAVPACSAFRRASAGLHVSQPCLNPPSQTLLKLAGNSWPFLLRSH